MALAVERLDPKPLVCGASFGSEGTGSRSATDSIQRLEVKPLHLGRSEQ